MMCLPFTHKWSIIGSQEIMSKSDERLGMIFYLQCGKCGDIKAKNIKPENNLLGSFE